jgi:hypothetical protein
MEAKNNRTVEFTGDLLEKPSRPRAANWPGERLLKTLTRHACDAGIDGPRALLMSPLALASHSPCARPDSASGDRGVLPDRCEPEDKFDKNL